MTTFTGDRYEELSRHGLELLDEMWELEKERPSTTPSTESLFNSRMRYIDSITAKLKRLNQSLEASSINRIHSNPPADRSSLIQFSTV